MKRRTFLGAASAAAVGTTTIAAPAITKGIRELKLVSSFTTGTVYAIAENLTQVSDGRLRVKGYARDELVGPFEVFDAVAEGLADMYYSTEYYWRERSPAFAFFTTVPFGLTPTETYAWLQHGGGQELWDELSAGFNLKPFAASSSGVQMGGWYNKEVNSLDSFKGLRLRMPGLGAEVMRRFGVVVVNLPPGDIVSALKSGALDAAEWVSPDDDLQLGIQAAAKYYYYPGFHEPATMNALTVNKQLWDSLSTSEKRLVETVIKSTYIQHRGTRHVRNIESLTKLLREHGVQLRKFDDDILRVFGKASSEVVAELGASDPFTKRVYESYMNFVEASRVWTDLSDRAYLNARALTTA